MFVWHSGMWKCGYVRRESLVVQLFGCELPLYE